MSTIDVTRLRPASMQSRPILIDRVFEEPDAVMRLIEARAPYVNLAVYHHMEDTLGGGRTQPRYRDSFDDAVFLQNPEWIRTAKESFAAEVVRPFKCILNLNGPMGGGGVHVDLPVYRGFAAPAVPVWLLMNMSSSGLFADWMVPIASGLAWFYRGAGGKFTYWPDGAGAPQRSETTPLWNRGVMSDNEYMFHAVGSTGTEEQQAALRGEIKHTDTLCFAGNAGWEIRGSEGVSARLPSDQVRVSLLWKAYVFKDGEHLASFEDRRMDLTQASVTDIYMSDLARRGLTASRPKKPLADPAWRRLLEATYLPPFTEEMAGDYS